VLIPATEALRGLPAALPRAVRTRKRVHGDAGAFPEAFSNGGAPLEAQLEMQRTKAEACRRGMMRREACTPSPGTQRVQSAR
jgi:hypothetical protein